MALYWPAFEFDFRLDMARLLPHMAAIESGRAAASLRMLPPQWRAQSATDIETNMRQAAAEQGLQLDEIQFRKQVFLRSNASRAQAWVKQRFAPGSPPMCLDDVQKMHLMVSEEAGVNYRTPGVMRQEGQAVITGTASIGLHVGAPAIKLPQLMDQYFQFIRSKRLLGLSPIIHALVAHFFITTIHPFGDGNGRVSRLVSAAVLYQRGYNGHGFYALSNYFYENEERYHRILFQQQQEPCPNLTEFVAFGMEALALELQGINNFIKFKLKRVTERKALTAGGSNQRRTQAVLANG